MDGAGNLPSHPGKLSPQTGVALSNDKGEAETGSVIRAYGDRAEVATPDGSVIDLPMWKLTNPTIKPEEDVEESVQPVESVQPTKAKDTKPEEVAPQQEAQSTAEQPVEKADQSLSLSVGDKEVTVANLTIKEREDTRKLYDFFVDQSQKNMSRNRNSAIKSDSTEAWASNSNEELSRRLKEAGLGELATTKYLKRLREKLALAGVLDASYAWQSERMGRTRLDEELLQQNKQAAIETRKKELQLRNKWLKIGKEVTVANRAANGHQGKIEEITEDGFVKVEGWPELIRPSGVNPKRQTLKKSTIKINEVETQTKEEQELKSVQSEPRVLFREGELIDPEFTFEGKDIVFRWERQQPGTRRNNTFQAANREEFAKAVREWVANYGKGARNRQVFKKLEGIQIGDKIYDAEIFDDRIEVAGLTVQSQKVADRESKKATISKPVKTVDIIDIGAGGPNRFEAAIDDKSIATKVLLGGADQLSKSRYAVVLREVSQDADYPYGSIRVVTLVDGKATQKSFQTKKYLKKGVAKGYNADSEKRDKTEKLKDKKKGFHTYEIIGRIEFSEAIGEMDIYYDNISALREDPAIKSAEEGATLATQEQTNKFKQVQIDNKRIEEIDKELSVLKKAKPPWIDTPIAGNLKFKDEIIEKEIAELKKSLKNIKPDESDLQAARDQIVTEYVDIETDSDTETDLELEIYLDKNLDRVAREIVKERIERQITEKQSKLDDRLKKIGNVYYPRGDQSESPVHKVSIQGVDFFITSVVEMDGSKTWYRYKDQDLSQNNPYEVRSNYSVMANTKKGLVEILNQQADLDTILARSDLERRLITEKQTLTDRIKSVIEESSEAELLKDMRSRIETVEGYLENGEDDKGNAYTKFDFNEDIESIRSDPKYRSITGEATTYRADFLSDLISSDTQSDIGEDLVDDVTEMRNLNQAKEEAGNEGSLSDQISVPTRRQVAVSTQTATAGKQQVLLENVDTESFIDLSIRNEDVLKQLKRTFNNYELASAKGGDAVGQRYYTESLNDLYKISVKQFTGSGKPFIESKSRDAKLKILERLHQIVRETSDLIAIVRDSASKEEATEALIAKTTSPDRIPLDQEQIDKLFALADVETNYLARAQDAVNGGEPYDSLRVLTDIFEHMGHTATSLTQKKVISLLSDPESVRDDAVDLSVDKIIGHINEDGLFDSDELKRLLEKVYKVEMVKEGKVAKDFSTQDTRENYIRMLDDLRQLINPNYISDHVYEDTDNSIIRGSRSVDPQVASRLNTKLPFLQNLIDPTTGKLYSYQVLPVDEESADASIANARSSEQSYMAPMDNPLSERPELVQEGQAAMQSFAPNGTTMSLRTSLNQILRLSDTFPEISNITRLLLDSKMIDKFEVEFVPWEKFRKYASPEKGVINKSAQVITKDPKTGAVIRKILISDAFNNNPDRKAMDNLIAEIVHEAIHVPVSPALDLGYAFSTGKPSVIKDAIDKHGDPSNLNSTGEELAGIFKTVNEKILPYLRERAGISDYYGLTSVDEFFTEAGSNSKFQEFLRNTQLPASVRKPGILQTIMDFVQSVLAKIGFASANTKSAMDYARTEMDKLMRIARERTELLEKIEESNLSQINILGNRFNPTNSEVSLDILQEYRSRIYNQYLEAFAEDSESGEVSIVINDNPQTKEDEESVGILDPYLKGILRALENDDWLGFDYPSQSIEALFDEETYEAFDVSPATKAAITRYVNNATIESNTKIRGNFTQIKGYHTTDGDVSKFETDPRKEIGGRQVQMGAHFGSTSGTVKKGRGRIVEVSLNINNPLRMPDLNKWDWRAMEKWLIDNNIFTAEDTKRYENVKETGGFREFVIQSILKQKGYDSIVYLNEFEGSKDKDSYIVFDSKNIEIDSNTKIRGNRFDESGLQRPSNPRPDDNARVMNEANAAGLNEVIEELIKVHREYGDKTKLDLGEFIDKYGDIGRDSRKPITPLLKKYKKDLEVFEIDSDSIRIESAGLNKTARVIGSRKAVGYLEKVRENARKRKERAKIAREVIEKNQNENQQMYEDLYKGRVPARDKLIESFKRRLTSASFQKLQSYVETLPNSGMSAKDIKSIKDLSNEQLGDIMDAVVEARGEIEFNNKEEVFNSLTDSTDARLAPIQGEGINAKVKRMMVMYAIRESKDVLSLLRLGKGLIGEEQQKFRNAASRIASAKTLEQVEQVNKDFPGIMSTPLRAFAKSKREEIKESGRLNKLNLKWEVNDFIDRALGDRSTRLRMALGELEPVAIYDGVEILTLVEDTTKKDASDPDRFKVEKFKVEIKGGKLINRDEFVKRNRVTLQALEDPEVVKRHGHEAWWESMKEQALLALSEPIMDEQFHAQRAAWFSGLQGITERLSNLGPDGIRISQMTTKSVALYRANHSETMAYAKRYNFAANRVMKHLKIGSQELYSGLYQDIWWWTDNHPEYKDAIDGYNALWKHLKEYASIPNRALLDDDARRYVKDMIQKALEARDHEASLNDRLGNRVKDDKIKVQSFINQEMVAFYRSPLDLGLATMPRTINEAHLLDVYNRMSQAGWEPKAEGDQPGAQDIIQEANKATSSEALQQVYESLFTEDVVNIFVRPFTHTDVRNSVFRGPQDKDGYSPQIGNSFMEEVFDESGGDVFAMSNMIYDQMAENPSPKDRLAWQKYFLGQWHKRYRQLRRAAARITKAPTTNSEMMRVTPQSMDARNVETSLPKEFFYYGQYDEVTSNIRLAMMTTTASFGRNGELMNKAAESSRKSLQLDAETFNGIMAQATSSKHPKPRPRYSKAEKTEAYRILRGRGFENAEKEWNRLRTNAINKAELERVTDHLKKYYGRTNPEGPLADANLLIDVLGTQALLVLNNPKSSFWQALSLFEYPNAFRGLNRMAGKGTAAALGNFINQTFGGMAESFGIEFGKMSRAAEYLKDTHFRTAESKLPFEVYTSMIGSGGELGESIAKHPLLGMKRYVRRLNDIATHHRTRDDNRQRAPIDPLSLITGIFPYINNVVNHSVGVGAVHSYTDLIHQVASYIETQGITEFKEFTPEDLGMGEGILEVVKGEKDGFDRMNKLLVSAGAPSISRLAFNYVDKKKNNPNAEIIDETTAQLINQIAMNQISGEGFTSSPASLTTNPFLRNFATFLRWPLGKMARDLGQIMRDPADRLTTMQALIKYTAITATVTMPAGLSFAMLIDWYDEDGLEKPNNLPPLSPLAALPVIGIPLAMRDEYFSVYAVTSRLAKAGTPFGIGLDLANNVFSKGDPYGSAREFSLDSRIFAFSMFKNLIDAFGTWATAGEFDWQLVGRPIAYGLGGNSILQMTDLVTAMMDIDSEERRVADYIGMRNYIKSTAFMMGIELRPPFKGGGLTTGTSMNTRQMARAAYSNDTEGFVAEYQEAIESAKEFLRKNGREDESPEQYVLNSYRSRDLRTGITARRLSDEQWQAILDALPEDVRAKISIAQQAHEHYLNLIKPRRSSSARRDAIRQKALSLM